MGGFSRALEGLQGSHKIAAGIGDPALELQVYVALSELFGRLQDTEKSARYAAKAYDLSRSLQVSAATVLCSAVLLRAFLLFCLSFVVGRFEFIAPSSRTAANGGLAAKAGRTWRRP